MDKELKEVFEKIDRQFEKIDTRADNRYDVICDKIKIMENICSDCNIPFTRTRYPIIKGNGNVNINDMTRKERCMKIKERHKKFIEEHKEVLERIIRKSDKTKEQKKKLYEKYIGLKGL